MSLRAVKTLGFASWFQLSFAFFFTLLIIVGIDFAINTSKHVQNSKWTNWVGLHVQSWF